VFFLRSKVIHYEGEGQIGITQVLKKHTRTATYRLITNKLKMEKINNSKKIKNRKLGKIKINNKQDIMRKKKNPQ
jgi:hypothetical protein